MVLLPVTPRVPPTVALFVTAALSNVDAPETPRVPPTVVLPVMAAVLDRVVAPVTPSVPPTVALPVRTEPPVTARSSVVTVPSKKLFLNLAPVEPRSKVFVVLGRTLLPDTIRSWLGPTLVIGAPSPAVPSCL